MSDVELTPVDDIEIEGEMLLESLEKVAIGHREDYEQDLLRMLDAVRNKVEVIVEALYLPDGEFKQAIEKYITQLRKSQINVGET